MLTVLLSLLIVNVMIIIIYVITLSLIFYCGYFPYNLDVITFMRRVNIRACYRLVVVQDSMKLAKLLYHPTRPVVA